jgi:nucleotide-binding universal stress UspA family protein
MTDQGGRVVVGYDGGRDAGLALAWAIETARREDRPLRVVVAASAMDPILAPGFHERTEQLAAQWRERAEKVLADAGLADTGVEVVHGPTLRVLLKAVTADDLLVVGSHGHAPFVETVGGSVSQHLARHACCPVVVVRPAHRRDVHRVVVGVDGSPESVAAARFACARARSTGETVVVVHGYQVLPFLDGEQDDHRHVADRRHRLAERLQAWLEPVRAAYPDVDLTAEVVPEEAPLLLAHESAGASLVAVGSRGRDAFADLLLGSTTQEVLFHARCPVAVVRSLPGDPVTRW